MVVIFVMDREFTESLSREFATAPRTDMRVKLERSLAIALLSKFSVAPKPGKDLGLPFGIWSRLFR